MPSRKKSLANIKVLISTGPTREYLDPVRFLSNPSSGKMGFAIAEEAKRRGAKVTLISGPVALPTPRGVNRLNVISAQEMFLAAKKHFPQCDIFISTAAVGDYTPRKVEKKKIKKSGKVLRIELKPTIDILGTLAKKKQKGQFAVGFAAETDRVLQYAKEKLKTKNLDLMVANDVSKKEIGFEVDTNQVWLIPKTGKVKKIKKGLKSEIAKALWEEIEKIILP